MKTTWERIDIQLDKFLVEHPDERLVISLTFAEGRQWLAEIQPTSAEFSAVKSLVNGITSAVFYRKGTKIIMDKAAEVVQPLLVIEEK